jgi:alpha/beta superfamily hydrolase
MPIKTLFISNQNIKIEAEWFHSNVENNEELSILLVHPHPQYGGNMNNNVISALFNIFNKNDISCLRFNFRGVGRSTGNHTDGYGEISDVESCIDFMLKNESKKILICGYSYGAAIGCSAVNYSENIIGYCAISFPWDFIGADFKQKSQSKKPKLFIQGNRDNIALYDKFDSHFNYYLEPKRKVIINGADHFYGGFEQEISQEVYNFFKSINH